METLSAGRYQVLEVLGETSLGRTCRATDSRTGKTVVIKSLRVHEGLDPKSLELLEREGRVLSNLRHPRIPGYIDLFADREAGGERRLSLVTEWVPGQNLCQVIASGKRFTEREVVTMALELVDVLAYLHGFSPPLLHRDIKPANLILTPTGKLYLVDFGGVRDKMMQDRSPYGGGTTIVGSYGYMPYEQFEGRAVPASDFYALAVMLVFLLSHKEPGELDKDGMRLCIRGEVNISEPFLELLEKMLSPDWTDRPQTAAELRDELSRLLEPGRPSRLVLRRRQMLAAGGLTALVATAVGIVALSRPWTSPPTAPAVTVPRRPAPAAPAEPPASTPALAVVGLPVARGRLLFDGRPVTELTRVAPTFWFRNEDTGRAEGGAARSFPDGRFEVYALAPGRHGMSVRIDANATNGYLLPGDFESWTQFTTAEDRVGEVDVSFRWLIHLTSPQDNGSVMKGWSSECAEKPVFAAPVRIAWQPLMPDVRYDYQIARVACPYRHVDVEASGSTQDTEIATNLARSGKDEFYVLTLNASKDGRNVGQMMTRGANGHGWDFRFRVD